MAYRKRVEFIVRVVVEVDGDLPLEGLRVESDQMNLAREGRAGDADLTARWVAFEHAPGRSLGCTSGSILADRSALDGLVRCERLAAALASRGLTVHVGESWDGASSYKSDAEPFWFLSPRGAGVTAYHERDGGTYDVTFLEAEGFDDILLPAVLALPQRPDRAAVYAAMETAPGAGGRA